MDIVYTWHRMGSSVVTFCFDPRFKSRGAGHVKVMSHVTMENDKSIVVTVRVI